ncbi:MAG TPA: hypothetical protein VJ751_11055 [Pyrinomonadaceae bacterium]|jgi:hypothetical protein|nr:hypothetical protein [Pyrinomonadaceae bacterium]
MNNQTKRILLISNSTLYGSGYLDHAEGEIRSFLSVGLQVREFFVRVQNPSKSCRARS